jgi:hypothetical protein
MGWLLWLVFFVYMFAIFSMLSHGKQHIHSFKIACTLFKRFTWTIRVMCQGINLGQELPCQPQNIFEVNEPVIYAATVGTSDHSEM